MLLGSGGWPVPRLVRGVWRPRPRSQAAAAAALPPGQEAARGSVVGRPWLPPLPLALLLYD